MTKIEKASTRKMSKGYVLLIHQRSRQRKINFTIFMLLLDDVIFFVAFYLQMRTLKFFISGSNVSLGHWIHISILTYIPSVVANIF